MSEQQRAMTFFTWEDSPTLDEDGMMSMAPSQTDPDVFSAFDAKLLAAGQEIKVLFKGTGPGALSLVHARFKPGYRLPRHTHDADCLYFVVRGEAHMGARVLKAGDGFFIVSDAPYAYSAGPEGVEVLEFRQATSFDIKIRDKTLADWKPVIDAVLANGSGWVEDKAVVTA